MEHAASKAKVQMLAFGYFSLYDFTVLDFLFNPRSVAVIGSSNDPKKVGFALINNLKRFNFKGDLFPVNPKPGEILGLPTYRDIISLRGEVDLAVISVPAPAVPRCLRDCVSKGVKSAVIISAGFKEAGADGILLENELKSIVKKSGIRVLGPNCLGVINTCSDLNATFAAGMLPKGETLILFPVRRARYCDTRLGDRKQNWLFEVYKSWEQSGSE